MYYIYYSLALPRIYCNVDVYPGCLSTVTPSMDKLRVLPGTSEFDKYVETGALFVDKSLFIRDFMNIADDVSVFLRPRRFGKSMNLSLLREFYSLGANLGKFKDVLIGKEEKFVADHGAQYPVVYIDFKGVNSQTWEKMEKAIWACLFEAFRPHLRDLDVTSGYLSHFDLNSKEPPGNLEYFLKFLLLDLCEQYNRKVIVLIDEYDTPLNAAYTNGFYKEASTFLGAFYGEAFKNNSYHLMKACLMGITEVREGSIISHFNNASIYSVVENEFSQYFGFTGDEIRPYCFDDIEFQKVIKWYDGYTVGNHKLINPWSFIKWYKKKHFQDYWIGTGGVNALSFELSDSVDEVFFEGLEMAFIDSTKLIEGFSSAINLSIFPLNQASIWSKLIHSGYLTYQPSTTVRGEGIVSIPNLELKDHWQKEIKTLLEAKIYPASLHEILADLQEFRLNSIKSLLELPIRSASFRDNLNENSYHMSCYGALCLATSSHPNIKLSSNRESGDGLPDLVVAYLDSQRAIIFEFKKSQSEADLDTDAQAALDQIKNKNYQYEYKDCQCLLIGVSFHRKKMSNLKTEILPPIV